MEKINTLWHFGDSFGCWGNPEQPDREAQIGFSQYIAQHYNVNFEHLAQQGASNDEITKRIISSMSKFRENDIILINWRFLFIILSSIMLTIILIKKMQNMSRLRKVLQKK